MSKKKDFTSAGEAMDKFFSEADESSQEVYQTITEGNPQEENKKGSEEPQKAQEGKKQRVIDTHKVFSFRAPIETVDSWRLWADAKGLKVDDLGEKALEEYIRRHPLNEDQKTIYELKKAQKKS